MKPLRLLAALVALLPALAAAQVQNNSAISHVGPPFSISAPTNGQALTWSSTAGIGGAWVNSASSGSGTVTSVGITSTSNTLTVTGTSPITGAGTLDLEVLAVPASALPNPSASTLGGVESLAAVSHNFLTSISTLGAPAQAQPAFSDLSGSSVCAQLPALTGDATTTAGTCATTVAKINGTALSGLATGLLKNTTSTGVPSIAAAGTDYVAPGTATTFAAAQTFPTSDIVIKGTSTGTTAIASANSGSSNFTKTFSAVTGTVLDSGTLVTVAQGGNGTASPAITAGTGIGVTGSWPAQAVASNAEDTLGFSYSSAAIVTPKAGFTKVVKASTVDNFAISANAFTCSVNPVVTLSECGTSTTCATPTTISSATLTGTGTVVTNTISSAAITAGDYVAWSLTGTCTVITLYANAQIHSN